MGTYGFKEGKNISDVYTKSEVDGLIDGIASEVVTEITPTLDGMQAQIDALSRNVTADIAAQNQTISNFQTAVNASLATKQAKHKTTTVTLEPANWAYVNGLLQQTVSVTGLKNTDTVIVAPSPYDSLAYGSYNVICNAQSTGSLTFWAQQSPSVSLGVYVLILEA